MARILIAYGTTEGQTAKIAGHIGDRLKQLGHEATVALAGEAGNLELADFDAVIVGASMHEGHYQREVRRFLKDKLTGREPKPGVFFSVSLGAASDDPDERAQVERIMHDFCADCGWTPSAMYSFAGALRYTQYSWLKRKVMQHIVAKEDGPTDTSQDFEFTDWDAVNRLAEEFVADTRPGPA